MLNRRNLQFANILTPTTSKNLQLQGFYAVLANSLGNTGPTIRTMILKSYVGSIRNPEVALPILGTE